MSITISHTAAEGTLVTGDTRPHKDTIKTHGLRWSRNIEAWYVRNSRDRHPDTGRIERLTASLREVGVEVTVEVDATPRPVADREADRADRADSRTEALEAKAERLDQRADALYNDYRQRAERIPFGQPILADHHSANRDRRYRERMIRKADQSFETRTAAESAGERAEAAEANQRHRLNGATTERRIDKLEAEQRQLQRKLDGRRRTVSKGTDGQPDYIERSAAATGDNRERFTHRLAEVEDELRYWRQHLAHLVETGQHRVWGPGDFVPGDYVRASGRWHEVLRVNRKSLTVPTPYSWTDTVPYDSVSDRRPAASEQPEQ